MEVDQLAEVEGASVALSGGEPLVRRDLPEILDYAAGKVHVLLTTNGMLLTDQAEDLARAGLTRLTVSLDTLRADRFERLTRRDGLSTVVAALEAARHAGLGEELKLVTSEVKTKDDIMDSIREFLKGGR